MAAAAEDRAARKRGDRMTFESRMPINADLEGFRSRFAIPS